MLASLGSVFLFLLLLVHIVVYLLALLSADVVIKEQLKNLRKIEGETAKMQCKVKNPKNYPIKWFKNGEEITFPSDK